MVVYSTQVLPKLCLSISSAFVKASEFVLAQCIQHFSKYLRDVPHSQLRKIGTCWLITKKEAQWKEANKTCTALKCVLHMGSEALVPLLLLLNPLLPACLSTKE